MSDKVRLGGMALGNGVLVHGPHGVGLRDAAGDGDLKVVARRKSLARPRSRPVLPRPGQAPRGALSAAGVKRALPEAKLPFERRACDRLDGRERVHRQRGEAQQPSARRPRASRRRALVRPCGARAPGRRARRVPRRRAHLDRPLRARRGRPKEHERCGSHLVGPLLLTTAGGEPARRARSEGVPLHGAACDRSRRDRLRRSSSSAG